MSSAWRRSLVGRLALVLVLAGKVCSLLGADTLETIRNRGVLLWGADAEGGAPYVYPDPQKPEQLTGFEYDLAEALAARLGWRWVPDPLDGGGGGWLCREPQPLDVLRHYQAPQDDDGRRHGSPPGVVYCVSSRVRYGEEGWTLTGDPEMIPVLADR